MEEWEARRINEAEDCWIIAPFFGNTKAIKALKDRHGIFRPYATGGFTEFNSWDIIAEAETLEELEDTMPEYFI